MINKSILVGLIVITLILITSCSQNIKEENIKVGVMLPLSGDFASWGGEMRKGIEDTASEGITFIFEDSKCAGLPTVSSFRKLTEIDKVQYIIGPACATPQEAIAPLMQGKDILTLIPIAATDKLFEKSDGKMFQMQYSLEVESAYLAKQIYERGYEKVALVIYENAFSRTHAENFKKLFKGEVEEFVFTDLTSVPLSEVTKIKAANADAIFVTDITFFLFNGRGVLEQLEIEVPIFSQYAIQYSPIRELVEGVIYSFPGDIKGDEGAEYNLAKQSTELIVELLSKCDGEYNCVLKEISNSPKFDDKGISTRPLSLKKIEGGKPISAETIDASCRFIWTGYSEENPCESCDYSDEKWVCMDTKTMGINLREQRLLDDGFLPGACGPCAETNKDEFSCEYLNGKCRKLN